MILYSMFASFINWFKFQTPYTDNRIWRLMDNAFFRVYVSGDTVKNRGGLRLHIGCKNQPDCTNGFKAIRFYRFWIISSKIGNYRKGYFWRKWDFLCSNLRMRFHYF